MLPAFRVAYLELLENERHRLAQDLRVLPGVQEVLGRLQALGVCQSLLTGNLEPIARLKLDCVGLGQYVAFERVATDPTTATGCAWRRSPARSRTAIGLFTSPALPRMSQRVLAAIAVRLGFLLLAIGLPGLFLSVAKRLIGRARPLVEGSTGPFSYRPLGWSVEYASLPSGHSIDAFAAATAIGALWPWTRPFMWTYAVVIALSRVVLTAHFPSDVMAGAVVGVVGVLLVRDWFATRGLAFVLGADGTVRPLPGPSFARIKRVARQLMAP